MSAPPPPIGTGRGPLHVVVASDSFKGCLSSLDAGSAISDGILDEAPSAVVDVVAVADGGEGTIDAFGVGWPLDEVMVDGEDAVGRPLRATYALRRGSGSSLAVIEAARTIGLVGAGPVDGALPPRAGSRGLGLHLHHALDAGVETIVVGLGGTACTDGGAGLLMALGARVTDGAGRTIPTSGNALLQHDTFAVGGLPDLTRVEVLTDVRSPLLGPEGAARVFAPQKGATPEQVRALESRMARWADALERAAGYPVRDLPGTGAAGGAGAALAACGARLVPGFDRVAEEVGLVPRLSSADLVVTGEGRIDAQTRLGKGPSRVAELARTHGAAVVVALAGDVETGTRAATAEDAAPFDGVFPVHRGPIEPARAVDPDVTRAALRASSAQVTRLVLASSRPPERSGGRATDDP